MVLGSAAARKDSWRTECTLHQNRPQLSPYLTPQRTLTTCDMIL